MPDEKDEEEERQADELAEQEDLNQGMSTGTHETTRHGVNWPPSYRRKLRVPAGDSTKRNAGTTTKTKTAIKTDDEDRG